MKGLINGLDINYKVIGEGRPLLILHGWGSASERWQKVGELLTSKGLKVIIPDLPGFGNSQKPSSPWGLDDYCNFIEEFIKFLNLEKFYLLGHSFGGALAVKFSLKFPEKITKLFLVSAACIRKESFKIKFLRIISKTFKIKPLFFRKLFYRKSDYLSVEGIMKEIYLKIIREDLSDTLFQIKVSTVIIWGGKDDVVKLKDGKIINQKIQNSKLIIIPEGNHDLERKIPKILVERISENL